MKERGEAVTNINAFVLVTVTDDRKNVSSNKYIINAVFITAVLSNQPAAPVDHETAGRRIIVFFAFGTKYPAASHFCKTFPTLIPVNSAS